MEYHVGLGRRSPFSRVRKELTCFCRRLLFLFSNVSVNLNSSLMFCCSVLHWQLVTRVGEMIYLGEGKHLITKQGALQRRNLCFFSLQWEEGKVLGHLRTAVAEWNHKFIHLFPVKIGISCFSEVLEPACLCPPPMSCVSTLEMLSPRSSQCFR